MLTRRDAEPAGAHRSNGGAAIRSGADRNGNGALDDVEVDHTEYVCDPATAALVRKDPDKYVRRNAVLALARVGDAEVVPALEALLDDAAIPEPGPFGDQRRIADEARVAIAAIRARAR